LNKEGKETKPETQAKAGDETSSSSAPAPPLLVMLNFPQREFVHLPLPTSIEVKEH